MLHIATRGDGQHKATNKFVVIMARDSALYLTHPGSYFVIDYQVH